LKALVAFFAPIPACSTRLFHYHLASENGARQITPILGRLAMGKLLALATVLVCGMSAASSAKTLTPPGPPAARYEMPSTAAGYPSGSLPEGRSIYQMQAPSPFWHGVDETGNPAGLQPNPQSGG
jgi:hypothetical protein